MLTYGSLPLSVRFNLRISIALRVLVIVADRSSELTSVPHGLNSQSSWSMELASRMMNPNSCLRKHIGAKYALIVLLTLLSWCNIYKQPIDFKA